MIETSIIDAVKRVPISTYLLSKGIVPTGRQTGKNKYVYCSPFTNERTPSFFVSNDETAFNDYSTGEKGDVIRLVQRLERCTFIKAVRTLQTFDGVPLAVMDTIERPTVIKTATDETTVTAIRQLSSRALIGYCENIRGIPLTYAGPFVKQIHYTVKKADQLERTYYGIGFGTDCGSWAVRSQFAKRWIGPATITTLHRNNSKAVNLFEGFFDFLSALVYYRTTQLSNTTIILNSTTHLNRALPLLREIGRVRCYLDNDNAGAGVVARLISEGLAVQNRANIYQNHNDFNDFIRTYKG